MADSTTTWEVALLNAELKIRDLACQEMTAWLTTKIADLDRLIEHQMAQAMPHEEARGELRAYKQVLEQIKLRRG